MSIRSSALFGFRLRSFEAHARRALNLAKLDQLSSCAPRQRVGCFVAKVRDRLQEVSRIEKLVERFASESENLVFPWESSPCARATYTSRAMRLRMTSAAK